MDPIDELVSIVQKMNKRGLIELTVRARILAREHPKAKPCQVIPFPQATGNSRANTNWTVDSET